MDANPGVQIPPHLAEHVAQDFTHLCHICGSTVAVVGGQTQPHRCRIEIS